MERSASLITVNYGAPTLVIRLLASLARHPERALFREVIVVDNGYPEASSSMSAVNACNFELPIRFVQNRSRSYAAGINAGASVATGEYLALSNNDVEWLPDFGIAATMAALRAQRDVGIAGPQLVFPDGSWQRSFGLLPSIAEALSALLLYEIVRNGLAAARFRNGVGALKPIRVGYVDGAFMVVRRACFESLGGFNDDYAFYGEDADFCARALEQGTLSVFVPSARLMHVRGASSTKVAGAEFLVRMHQARVAFVARRQGPRAATIYRWLLKFSTWEAALLHAVAWCLRPSPRRRQRMDVALSAARATARMRVQSAEAE